MPQEDRSGGEPLNFIRDTRRGKKCSISRLPPIRILDPKYIRSIVACAVEIRIIRGRINFGRGGRSGQGEGIEILFDKAECKLARTCPSTYITVYSVTRFSPWNTNYWGGVCIVNRKVLRCLMFQKLLITRELCFLQLFV